MVIYPPLFFLRQYLMKRYFLNGWAGFISAATGAFYVFLKYAKVCEARRRAALTCLRSRLSARPPTMAAAATSTPHNSHVRHGGTTTGSAASAHSRRPRRCARRA